MTHGLQQQGEVMWLTLQFGHAGQLLGPIATAAGLYFAGKEQPNQQKHEEATTKTVDT